MARQHETRRAGARSRSGMSVCEQRTTTRNLPIEQFREAIRIAGIEPPEFFKLDGKLHRFSSDGSSGDDAGWYVFYNGGIPAAAFGCWRADISETWRADIGREFTEEEGAAHRRQMEDGRRKREAEEKKRKAKAREEAAAKWEAAAPASEHPYLCIKGVHAHGTRIHEGKLVVPLRDAGGTLHSLQFIGADGGKLFLYGGHVSGCDYPIGKPNGLLCIAEGFATAASIHEATGHAVSVAFNCGNMLPAAKALRAKFPDLRMIVCADDDIKKADNPGMRDARKAAQAVGALLAAPDFGPDRPEDATDFNDLCRIAGPDAVRVCIEKAVRGEKIGDQGDDTGDIDVEAEIKRLARLTRVEYDRVRIEEAARLGIRVTTLDKEVSAERQQDVSPGSGRSLTFPELEPWPEPVNGADLLSCISSAIRKYVVLTAADADAIALWCVHTHCFDAFLITPRLAITSPEKRCGKTTALRTDIPLSCR